MDCFGSMAMDTTLGLSPDKRFDFISKLAAFPEKVQSALALDPTTALSVVYLDLNTDICNHNCTFCDGFYRKLKANSIPTARLLRLVEEMEEVGVTAVVIAGDRGEPLLHSGAACLLERLGASPIAVGLYTNGTILGRRVESALANMAWVRVSVDAGTAQTHQRMHNYPSGRRDFDRVIANLSTFRRHVDDLGVSFILDPNNVHEIELGADVLLQAGARFIEYKPKYLPGYSVDAPWLRQHAGKIETAIATAQRRWGKRVVVNPQVEAVLTSGAPAPLTTTSRPCRTSLLRMVISTHGCYTCTPFRGERQRRFGDILTQTLQEVLASPERRSLTEEHCDRLCSYNQQNAYLLELEAGSRSLAPRRVLSHSQDPFI